MPLFGDLFTDEPLPVNGYLELSDKPGFGVTLNREGLKLVRPYPRCVVGWKGGGGLVNVGWNGGSRAPVLWVVCLVE